MRVLPIKTKSKQYNIYIGYNAIMKLNNILKRENIDFKKCLIVTDKNVPKVFVKKIKSKINSNKKLVYLFNASEKNKSLSQVNSIIEILLKNNFTRNDAIICLGGGIAGDVSGFSASIFKRGLIFINIPSTLLSQVDSSIGGKTGVNNKFGKNLIGSFYQPNLVISDIKLLESLPRREIICGFAEILKHSFISDKKFFKWIEKNTKKIINNKDYKIINSAIFKSCKIKISFVQKDEKEKGDRAILNFGHTFAHGIEAASNFSKKINHGEAVLIGMYLASKLSKDKNICSKKTLGKIINFYKENNLPNDLKQFSLKNKLDKIIELMKNDKKNVDSKISLILLKRIGKTTKPGRIKMTPKQIKLSLKKFT